MPTVLQKLALLSPWRLLVSCWAALVVLGVLTHIPFLEGVATAIAFAMVVGYPYALILGLQPGVVRESIRTTTRWLLLGFGFVLLGMAVLIPFAPEGYSTPTHPTSVREWFELLFGLLACLTVFAPFFLGTAALNDVRRHLRQDPTMESLIGFLALYFGIFGGWLYVHRQVREVLHAG